MQPASPLAPSLMDTLDTFYFTLFCCFCIVIVIIFVRNGLVGWLLDGIGIGLILIRLTILKRKTSSSKGRVPSESDLLKKLTKLFLTCQRGLSDGERADLLQQQANPTLLIRKIVATQNQSSIKLIDF